MNIDELKKLIGQISVREAYGYKPSILVQGMTEEQLNEILTLARLSLASPVWGAYLHNPDPRDQSGPTC